MTQNTDPSDPVLPAQPVLDYSTSYQGTKSWDTSPHHNVKPPMNQLAKGCLIAFLILIGLLFLI